jgi:hypothetical protein
VAKETKPAPGLRRIINRHRALCAQAKANYKAADELMSKILTMMLPGETVSFRSGLTVQLVDRYADGVKVGYKACAFPRFDLKEVKPK